MYLLGGFTFELYHRAACHRVRLRYKILTGIVLYIFTGIAIGLENPAAGWMIYLVGASVTLVSFTAVALLAFKGLADTDPFWDYEFRTVCTTRTAPVEQVGEIGENPPWSKKT